MWEIDLNAVVYGLIANLIYHLVIKKKTVQLGSNYIYFMIQMYIKLSWLNNDFI